jgi:RNA polymerase sigma-70 factor (ECF subfamily)
MIARAHPLCVEAAPPRRRLPGAAVSVYAGAMTAPEIDEPAADDRRDIARAIEGDGDAYARLVRRYQASVAHRMWRFTRDAQRHADLVHDVFVEAWMSLPSYRGRAPWLHWLRKIATRVGYRYWRDRDRRKRVRDDDVRRELAARLAMNPADAEPLEAADLVHAVLDRLPPRDRLVMTLMYLEERSVAEIAAQLDWSATMVKVQAWRARKKFRKLLAELGLEASDHGRS